MMALQLALMGKMNAIFLMMDLARVEPVQMRMRRSGVVMVLSVEE